MRTLTRSSHPRGSSVTGPIGNSSAPTIAPAMTLTGERHEPVLGAGFLDGEAAHTDPGVHEGERFQGVQGVRVVEGGPSDPPVDPSDGIAGIAWGNFVADVLHAPILVR
jgi:hypothetical protein